MQEELENLRNLPLPSWCRFMGPNLIYNEPISSWDSYLLQQHNAAVTTAIYRHVLALTHEAIAQQEIECNRIRLQEERKFNELKIIIKPPVLARQFAADHEFAYLLVQRLKEEAT